MSQQDLWAVVGRAKADPAFATQLFHDFEGALAANGYTLTPEEIALAKRGGGAAIPAGQFQGQAQGQAQQPMSSAFDENLVRLQQDEMAKMARAQTERMIDLGKFTSQTLKDTIQHATMTYKKITMMNQVMFWMGVFLFLFAALYAVYTQKVAASLVFAGLGTASFVGVFLLGPLGKTQGALSDLISAEIAFMSYFEQIFLIEGFARIPSAENSQALDPVRVEKASEMMQQRSVQTADLLHLYLDKKKNDGSASR